MPNLLLVEGRDDAFVFNNLLTQYSINSYVIQRQPDSRYGISILNEGGIDNLLKVLPQRLLATNTPRLGIVVDADTNITNRWNQIRDILISAGYDEQNVPIVPDKNGTMISQTSTFVPTVGIWIMPDNDLPGMLENFVEFLVPANDRLWQLAKDAVDQLPEQRFPDIHLMKAYVHTWLAWQEEPGPPMGLAITMKYLNPQEQHAQQFVQWIRNVFAV